MCESILRRRVDRRFPFASCACVVHVYKPGLVAPRSAVSAPQRLLRGEVAFGRSAAAVHGLGRQDHQLPGRRQPERRFADGAYPDRLRSLLADVARRNTRGQCSRSSASAESSWLKMTDRPPPIGAGSICPDKDYSLEKASSRNVFLRVCAARRRASESDDERRDADRDELHEDGGVHLPWTIRAPSRSEKHSKVDGYVPLAHVGDAQLEGSPDLVRLTYAVSARYRT